VERENVSWLTTFDETKLKLISLEPNEEVLRRGVKDPSM